ncbi:MAG: uroporphyrinogen-III synthase [Alphaproteobacteria bacterium]|nr:uroporphyrinogen-III synthase [Alphaproteobacteria bacterium]
MKALVTRPRQDAAGLVAALAARGIEPLLEPLLAIELVPGADAALAAALVGAQALLFTSANGARAFAAATPRRDLPAFAVGDATARAARAAGFDRVESAGGDIHALVALVAQRLRPEAGALVHAAASAVAGDLAGALTRAGFAARRVRLYDAVAASSFGAESRRVLGAGAIDFAIFFSPRTAETFVRLARAAGLDERTTSITAIVLSPAVAAALGPLAWRQIEVAAAPNEAALLAALDRVRRRVRAEGRGEHP